jgi:nitrite reductase/ring-hydroxylating ferredoxin subunit
VSLTYAAVSWTPEKKHYDRVVGSGVLGYLAVFIGLGFLLHPEATVETLVIRALGTGALLLLHVVLAIGPLCRLNPRFLPLLYNRRHLGVTMFLLAFAHGSFSIFQFHFQGDINPFVSLLTANSAFGELAQFPFELLGLASLGILFLMAATSHDFWLETLTPRIWKTLHMCVYAAYLLLVAHVSLGALQTERAILPTLLLGAGIATLVTLHLAAAGSEVRSDRAAPERLGWVDAGLAETIAESRARVITVGDERVAVFRYDNKLSAISNVCRHQNGPLGEGRIIDGCVTCPWHGYQYLPDCGASPPPFTEKVPTYRLRLEGGRVWIDPNPLPPGTHVEPLTLSPNAAERVRGRLPDAVRA